MLSALVMLFAAIATMLALHLRPLAAPQGKADYSRYFDAKGLLIESR